MEHFHPTDAAVARMNAGRELAALDRHRGRATGGAKWGQSVAARNAAFDAAYPDEASRAEWLESELERQAVAQEAESARMAELERIELERFGTPLTIDDLDDMENLEREAGRLPSPRHVAAPQSTPARTREKPRRRKGNSMDAKECERIILRKWVSVYDAAYDLGMSYRQLYRIVRGQSPVHPALARLLRAMVDFKIKPEHLRD